MNFKTYKYKRK